MLQLVPLGGLGEIGMNALVVGCRGERLLIDCGVMFPTADLLGVDVILPDFRFLTGAPGALKGVVLTHGHEDHVGGLPYLLSELGAHRPPVYGTRFTLALLKHRLDELGVEADLREVSPREPFQVGSVFRCEASRVTHTVPDAVGYVIRTPDGALVHTGDFKLDPDPIDGQRTDLERWGEVADEEDGVLALLSDSTNSERVHETPSERVVEQTFAKLLPEQKGRVVVGMFASNVHRVRHTLELCQRVGRRVVLMGRSMARNVEMARELGYLKVPAGLLVSADGAARLPAHQVAVITTGSQAEPRAGLSQLAAGEGAVRLDPGDTVILSSRAIPGNERAVGALIDALMWRGAKVIYADLEPGVHVSGHASRPQQQRVLETVRPRFFVPVHGELRHMARHLATARDLGMEPANLFLAKDGDILELSAEGGRFAGAAPVGRVMRDRFGSGAVTMEQVAERARMAETGLVVASLAIRRDTLEVVAGPELESQGLSLDERAQLPRVAEEARRMFLEMSRELRGDTAAARDELARSVRRAFKLYLAKRPAVIPVIMKL